MRFALGLALLGAALTALLFLKATNEFRRHGTDRLNAASAPGDLKTTFHSAADTTRGQQYAV